MSDPSLFEIVSALVTMLINQMWAMVASLFDLTRHISSLGAGMAVVGLCVMAFGVAKMMQARLVHKLEEDPRDSVSLWRQEAAFSLPGLFVFLLALPALLIRRVVRGVIRLITSLVSSSDDEASGEEQEEPVSLVVASIGPSFMWAGLAVAALYVLGWLLEPLLRYQFDLSSGYPAWQYLILGGRAELEWYLPLERFPHLGALCALFVWGSIWWWAGRIVRIVLGRDIGSNLAESTDTTGVLASWRSWFGARKLFETDASYRRWAWWLPVAALPLLIWGWTSFSAAPYRMGSSMFAVSLLLWLSWVIHLSLSGHWHIVEEAAEPEPEPEPKVGKGWAEVLGDLRARLDVDEPHTFEPPRLVEPPARASQPPEPGLISPLLDEVLLEGKRYTHMQQSVLETLSHQAYVHVDPPVEAGELALGRTSSAGMDDQSRLRHRNQIVLAPDGSGKTTLAMLAAFNHALVHTRTTLVITRDEQAAERFAELLRSTLEPSTLRWTVRPRLAGSTLVNDLSQGIIPDVIVTSLHQLVTGILDEPRTYSPFLKNLGLIVVDDVESFCGPVEIHMQLAFRRLTLRVRQLTDTRQLGEESAPVTLVLGADSMHDTPAWAKTLCGIDAVTRVFGYDRQQASNGSDGLRGVESAASNGSGGLRAVEEAAPGRYQLFYQLSDFATDSGERVSVQDIVAACERVGVAWHYRTCGDARRHSGWRDLRLEREPEHDTDSPLEACVVFLAGSVSEVRREVAHLSHAGLRYHPAGADTPADANLANPVAIAFVSVVDADERMALTEMSSSSALADVIRTLPRPVVRAPFGRAVESHLSADLVDTWMEVADILEVFGNTTVETLARLADSGLLVHESHTDLDANKAGYEERVHVRVPSRAVAVDEQAVDQQARSQRAAGVGGADVLLAPKVNQVELPPGESVAIRDHTNLTLIERTDRESARHLYYPGRIFESARGRYVVVGAAGEQSSTKPGGPVSDNDILVEPFLNDDVSSPRRRTRLEPLASAAEAGSAGGEALDAEPVFIGDFPVAVSLGPVECKTTHAATFRLDPTDFSIRQRILFGEAHAPSKLREPDSRALRGRAKDRLQTVALGIIANPALDIVDDPDCPRLELRDARLIAATMRAILPSMYRGSSSDIQVALEIAADNPAPEHVLGPQDGFFLYDPHAGGNGAAQAIHRDGVELLLRLCRVYLERVLHHERLRARYDFWADIDALFGRRERSQPGDGHVERRERDRSARRRALTWLDSRLRPEARATGGRRGPTYGTGSEEGEGDVFDIGRCWYSEDGSVTDLVWTKHRWGLDDGTDAMCDVGMGRKAAARTQSYTADSPQIAEHLAWIDEQLANPGFELDDQTIWGAARGVWSISAGEDIPVGSDGNLPDDEAVQSLHRLALGVACDSFEPVGPLAELLVENRRPDAPADQAALVRFISDFVQGIPRSSDSASEALQGPVYPLIHRAADRKAQALLLALLLKHADIDSGLFYHPDTGRALGAAALIDSPVSTDFSANAAVAEHVARWRQEHARADRALMFAELPAQPGRATGNIRLYVPIDIDRHELIVAEVENPEEWVFLPLGIAWLRMGL